MAGSPVCCTPENPAGAGMVWVEVNVVVVRVVVEDEVANDGVLVTMTVARMVDVELTVSAPPGTVMVLVASYVVVNTTLVGLGVKRTVGVLVVVKVSCSVRLSSAVTVTVNTGSRGLSRPSIVLHRSVEPVE